MANEHSIQNQDSEQNPIQALKLKVGGGGNEVLTTGSTSTAFTSNAIRVLATEDEPRIRVGPGVATADATDILLVVGIPEYFSVQVGQLLHVVGGTVEVTNFQVH